MLIDLPHHPTPAALLASPLLYATARAHGLGFVVLQRAFQHGGPIASLGPMTAATNLLPMAAGVLLLGERTARTAGPASPCASARSPLRLRAPGRWPGATSPPLRHDLARRN